VYFPGKEANNSWKQKKKINIQAACMSRATTPYYSTNAYLSAFNELPTSIGFIFTLKLLLSWWWPSTKVASLSVITCHILVRAQGEGSSYSQLPLEGAHLNCGSRQQTDRVSVNSWALEQRQWKCRPLVQF